MNGKQTAALRQQAFETLCSASIRALSGDSDLHYRARRLHRGRRLLPYSAPHLSPSAEHDDAGSFRGAADGMALRVLHSDDALHQRLMPEEPVARALFELLEQLRVEAFAGDDRPGLRRNLRHRHEQWSLAVHRDGMTETDRGLLLYTVVQVCRARVTAQPVVEATEGLIEAMRMALAPQLGHALAGLRRERHDQVAYAVHALAVVDAVAGRLRGDPAASRRPGTADEAERDGRDGATPWLTSEPAIAADAAGTPEATAGGRRPGNDAGAYRAYTTVYDRELNASTLVRAGLLKEYRERLDRRLADQHLDVGRLAQALRAALAVPVRDGWDGAQEEGRIDGRRLAQLVASPTERRLFRIERHEPVADCLVSFLIDCSGSMRQHVESVALLVDVFARALEQAGAASEVLGYTTGAWNGGRAFNDWRRAGRPEQPGRLNEVDHLVFKSADMPWRRARPGIAALLKADLFREGIDGEAVEWAGRRLQARGESRRLLVVVSDGCPMDGATGLANDAGYLDRHLRDVLTRLERNGRVEVCGVGIGADPGTYHGRSRVLDLSSSVTNTVLREIVALIAGPIGRTPAAARIMKRDPP